MLTANKFYSDGDGRIWQCKGLEGRFTVALVDVLGEISYADKYGADYAEVSKATAKAEGFGKKSTPKGILDIIASRVPDGIVDTQTPEFLAIMGTFGKTGSVRASAKPEHESFETHRERYERATGQLFTPETDGEREDEPLRLNCTFPAAEAAKLGLPVFANKDAARAAGHEVFYLTPFFGSDTEVLVGGRRYTIGWFAIEELGMYLGGPEKQDHVRIAERTELLRQKFEGEAQ